jgi:PH/SEC7 domain-containing protein
MLKTRPSMRGGDRVATLKRGSIRGFSSLLGTQNSGQGNFNPYFQQAQHSDGRVSPAPSYATSQDGGFMSSPALMVPTLGFASNLSHTIIREAAHEHEDDERSVGSGGSGAEEEAELSDTELALLGAPWAKEGIVGRKHYWERTGKKAKDRAWRDVFVVISKGELSMFTFGDFGGGGGVVGGGNWLVRDFGGVSRRLDCAKTYIQENAVPLGVVPLAHSLAHALPPPGYNRQRPHCSVLTLANGGTYFFQAGTEELVTEWTSACNYWAARTSKEPLAGGVSNMEYGWNRIEDDPVHLSRVRSGSEEVGKDQRDKDKDGDTGSVRSGKSTRSKFGRSAQTVRSSPWNERMQIHDWKPPIPSTVPSGHDEEAQLDALRKHVKAMNRELSQHNELKAPMIALVSPCL